MTRSFFNLRWTPARDHRRSAWSGSKEDGSLAKIIPDLPRIVGLRNRLIHGYDSVDPELVWDVTKNKIPPLRKQLDLALSQPGT
ncbi:DUF86 domain-containing protein [Luteolibacter yonseiensis]|uniref:DUF86 domain-containing protein n=1 Tax=Luteolibacter yonseiensis TaxID=1144680 RepID=A0A934V7P6_9BACT|nr:DUF86 domain-containing protein [Luteolibacter yonseiensis]